jgi:hypothetical protein
MRLNLRKRIHFVELVQYGIVAFLFGTILTSFLINTSHPFSYGSISPGSLFFAIAFTLVAWYIVYYFWVSYSLRQRESKLRLAAGLKGMKPYFVTLSPTMTELAEEKIGVQHSNNFIAEDWGFTDYHFSRYISDKYGRRQRSVTYYYAVASFQLPRSLPNVFFDSRHTGSREFKNLFKSSQRHSLEGNFDRHFTTYFHEDYRIDNMSFITPEVMEVLLLAKGYDIEIYQDELYLYNELEDMPWQLDDMERKGKLIRQKLLNNILTYRDERLDFEYGRKMVSLQGVKLRRSVTWTYVFFSASFVAVTCGLWLLFSEGGQYAEVGLYFLAFGLSTGFIKGKKLLDINRQEAIYRKK